MASAYYDIQAQQDSTLDLHLEYLADDETPINMGQYSARFHVKPSSTSDVRYLEITGSGVTSGVTGGSGGVYLNCGETGGVLLGGVRIFADTESMGYVPEGSWHYSLELTAGDTTEEIMHGRFVVFPKVTRG